MDRVSILESDRKLNRLRRRMREETALRKRDRKAQRKEFRAVRAEREEVLRYYGARPCERGSGNPADFAAAAFAVFVVGLLLYGLGWF